MPHRRFLLTAAVAIALTFAGCLSGPDDTPAATDDTPQTGGDANAAPPATNQPQPTTPPEPNRAPTAGLAVSNASGVAPFTVTFTIEGTDPDGDSLVWTLDADGDGVADRNDTMAVTTLEWTYETAGNFTALLTVSDGEASANATTLVEVREPEAPAVPDPITITGTITGAWAADAGYLPETNEHTFDLLVPVKNITVSIAFGATAFDLDYALYAPDGTVVDEVANFNEPTGNIYDASEPAISTSDPGLTGQTGTWTIEVKPGISVNGGYTLTVTFA